MLIVMVSSLITTTILPDVRKAFGRAAVGAKALPVLFGLQPLTTTAYSLRAGPLLPLMLFLYLSELLHPGRQLDRLAPHHENAIALVMQCARIFY